MDILVITREFPPDILGGMGYHLGYLYSEIADKGHNVTVLSGTCKQSKEAAHSLVNEKIDIYRIDYGSFSGHHIRFPFALKRFLRGFDVAEYDIALTHTHIPFSLPVPTIQKYHDCSRNQRPFFRRDQSYIEMILDSLIDPSRTFVEQRSLHHLSHAIFNSNLCRNAWRDHYEIPISTTTIYNGVDTDIFYPRVVDVDEEYVLFVGNSTRKGLDRVKTYAKDSSTNVYVVGVDEISDSNMTALGRVNQDQLAELYSGATATIHPARFEAFGNIILESLACGTPVVTTSQCGASEIITKDVGIVGTDIGAGVKECRNMSQDACLRIARQHTWEKVADRTLDCITPFI